MSEPADTAARAAGLFSSAALAGQRVVITAGPTREALDPVRYLSNHSSGKMGFALAEAAVAAGAVTQLISGPVHLDTPAHVIRHNVESARDMLAATEELAADCDIFNAVAGMRAQSRYRRDGRRNEPAPIHGRLRGGDGRPAVARPR